MAYSQKYTFVAFIEPVESGATFDMADWPLHITLADVFAIDINSQVNQQLEKLAARQEPLSLSVGDDTILGTTRVALINDDNNLQKFHEDIIDLLEQYGAEFNSPEFTGKGFLAHSTIQKSGRLIKDDEIKITSMSLVDMFVSGDWQKRKILKCFQLKKR